MNPSYNVADLIQACEQGQVNLRSEAVKDGAGDFQLYSEKEIVKFIAGGGLRDMNFINSKPLEKTPLNPLPMVDAYHFCSGRTFGYLAFYFSPKTGRWIIKSFHKDPDKDPRFFPFEGLGKFLEGMSSPENPKQEETDE